VNVVYAVVVSLLTLVSYLRWLRVAQREHLRPGRLLALEGEWVRARPVEGWLLGLVVLVCLASFWLPWGGVVGALLWLSWPVGEPFGGGRIEPTGGIKRVAAIVVALHVVLTVVLTLVPSHAYVVLPIAAVPLVEFALLLARTPQPDAHTDARPDAHTEEAQA
jgi:UDP-N-acetylmuramoyl-tripeptide--D-alanyl-D-alanine ligase